MQTTEQLPLGRQRFQYGFYYQIAFCDFGQFICCVKQSIERSASVAAFAARGKFGRRALGNCGQCGRIVVEDGHRQIVFYVCRGDLRPHGPCPDYSHRPDRPRIGRFACQTGVLPFPSHHRPHIFQGPGIERSHIRQVIEGKHG